MVFAGIDNTFEVAQLTMTGHNIPLRKGTDPPLAGTFALTWF
jgi:hypothetical protein